MSNKYIYLGFVVINGIFFPEFSSKLEYWLGEYMQQKQLNYSQKNYDCYLICYVNSEDYTQQNRDQGALGIFLLTFYIKILGNSQWEQG